MEFTTSETGLVHRFRASVVKSVQSALDEFAARYELKVVGQERDNVAKFDTMEALIMVYGPTDAATIEEVVRECPNLGKVVFKADGEISQVVFALEPTG